MIAKTYILCCAGDGALLPAARAALKQIHDCGFLVNDLHPKNVVIRLHEDQVHECFVDFNHSCLVSPSAAQRKYEMASLHMALKGPAPVSQKQTLLGGNTLEGVSV